MDTRHIVHQTMKNMDLLYQDVGETLLILEERMTNNGFNPLGDAGCTWGTSTAYKYPNQWLYKWFARVYYKHTEPKKAVGFCLHLGAYQPEWEDKLFSLGVQLPAFSVSVIEFPKEVSGLYRAYVFDSFWCAGWTPIENPSIEGKFVRSDIVENALGKAVTYFVDFSNLKNKALTEQLIVTPMLQMFSGNLAWVNQQDLAVVRLTAAT